MRGIWLQTLEVILLIPAFLLLIPPVPSTPASPTLSAGLFVGGACFAISLALSVYRQAQPWWLASAKLLGFLAFGWLLFERTTLG